MRTAILLIGLGMVLSGVALPEVELIYFGGMAVLAVIMIPKTE